MGKAGGLWIRAWWEMGRVAPIGNNTKCISVSVTQCMFLPLSVIFLNCVVYIVNVSITLSGSLILSMVCMCSLCVFFILKRLCKLTLPLFLKKLPFRKHFPPTGLVSPSCPKPGTNYGDSAPPPRPYHPSPNLEARAPAPPASLHPCFPLGFRIYQTVKS